MREEFTLGIKSGRKAAKEDVWSHVCEEGGQGSARSEIALPCCKD